MIAHRSDFSTGEGMRDEFILAPSVLQDHQPEKMMQSVDHRAALFLSDTLSKCGWTQLWLVKDCGGAR